MMVSLRQWQKDCVTAAIEKYQNNQKHFFCLAATASGKTLMAAEVARQLLHQEAIDIVLCFCPTNEIQISMKRSFEQHLGHVFDQKLKAQGSVLTYQSMLFQPESFWSILQAYRVLVVFDEIHHCAGTDFSRNNAWGSQILKLIAEQAAFILCLSGTPWRSDKLPITTALYDQHGQIQCDYAYGLADAVRDGVCRKPTIVLIDNDKIQVELTSKAPVSFPSIAQALKDSPLQYTDLLLNETVQKFLLKKSIAKLDTIRAHNPQAGGLVVASSVEHAVTITQMLKYEYAQSAVVVSYLHPNSSQVIDQYRNDTTRWIVSVGMVSEGTDIPRLQVCCHLSHIRTEVYFRQILGRILRITGTSELGAFLYMLAEPNLSQFAQRLRVDIPEIEVNFENMAAEPCSESLPENIKKPSPSLSEGLFFDFKSAFSTDDAHSKNESTAITSQFKGDNYAAKEAELLKDFELNETAFIEQLVGLYDNNPS